MALRDTLRWTKGPLIINAPMGGFAGPDLACAVSRSGGLGLMGATNDMHELEDWLQTVDKTLDRVDDLLPIGVGILTFIAKLDEAMPILEKYRPAVVWLFAAKQLEDYAVWAQRVRGALSTSQVWIQVGPVEAARRIAHSARPDVMCVQGADAGGHGYEKGAGVISMLPEVADALAADGLGHITLVAAGGIADGRSAAAALALGAQGVVMGTRFISARETKVHPVYQQAILAARDGGQSTTRSKLFDNLRGPNIWPAEYDGRSIIVQSFHDHVNGVDIAEIRKKHNEAVRGDDRGFERDGKGRAAIWAGTGVGFATRVQAAAEIVEEVRGAARQALEEARARI